MLVTKTNDTNVIQHYIDDTGKPTSINPGQSAVVEEDGRFVDINQVILRSQAAGGFTYTGIALAGTGPLQPGWAISKVPTGQEAPKTWAGASTRLNKIWNIRLTYSYG